MSVKIVKKTLQNKYFNFNAMAVIPDSPISIGALFTHGYTASKGDCLNWAQRLSDGGISTVIFDLPGHHLGSYNKVESFADFRDHAHTCFDSAWNFLLDQQTLAPKKLVLGGHSLGALLAVKALELPSFSKLERLAIGVGLGIGQHKTAHLFETSFYQKTLNIRRQLVDSNIDSDLVFPWIKEEKLNSTITNQRIHLITGEDDVVVGAGGMEALAFQLREHDNEVTLHEPKKLPHHEPQAAATHIYSFLKKQFTL